MLMALPRTHRVSPKFRGQRRAVPRAAGALVGLLLMAAACADTHAAQNSPAPSPTAAVTACPDTFDTRARPTGTRGGALVPDGASTALLCSYAPTGSSAAYPLDSSTPSQRPAAHVVTTLNKLEVDAEAHQTDRVCAMMARTTYTIVLIYPDGNGAVVNVNPNCATVARDDTVRQVNRLADLFAAWPEPKTGW